MPDYVLVDRRLLEAAVSAVKQASMEEGIADMRLVASLEEAASRCLPSLYVIISGGMVDCIQSDQPRLLADAVERITVIDHDTRGVSKDAIEAVQELDGTIRDAIIYEPSIVPPTIVLR